MKRQRGFIDLRPLIDYFFSGLIAVLLVTAMLGWALIEGAIWLWNHVSITLV